jgi:hypothetical protein
LILHSPGKAVSLAEQMCNAMSEAEQTLRASSEPSTRLQREYRAVAADLHASGDAG